MPFNCLSSQRKTKSNTEIFIGEFNLIAAPTILYYTVILGKN